MYHNDVRILCPPPWITTTDYNQSILVFFFSLSLNVFNLKFWRVDGDPRLVERSW